MTIVHQSHGPVGPGVVSKEQFDTESPWLHQGMTTQQLNTESSITSFATAKSTLLHVLFVCMHTSKHITAFVLAVCMHNSKHITAFVLAAVQSESQKAQSVSSTSGR